MSEVISRKDAKALGLKRYFTGSSCPKGHVTERFVSNTDCVGCLLERNNKYYAENADKVSQRKREFYAENADAMRERSRRWSAENPDKRQQYAVDNAERISERMRQYYLANKEMRLESGRRYAAENVDKTRERHRRYQKDNREVVRANCRNRRARRRAAQGTHTAADIQALYCAQGGRCKVCDASFTSVKYHVDHIVALANGGSNWPENLQLLCYKCNISKGAKDFETWWLGRMLGSQSEAQL